MRNFKIVLGGSLFSLAAVLAGCSSKAVIDGTLSGASDADVIVELLDVNKLQPLDTLKTDASGKFTYKVPLEEGQPEFIYLFHDGTRIGSLLLKKGDKVKVVSDTLGNYTVTGSDETSRLLEVEKDEEDFASDMASMTARLDDMDPSSPEAGLVRQSMAKRYITYYRDRVKYVMSNPYSLTVIPVLYQNVTDNMPLFSQPTDAMHFRNACDSLKKVYPDSRYVKALDEEAKRRMNILEMDTKLKSASQVGFPDVELPDIEGKQVKISDIDSKVVMVHFWTSEDASQKMFNIDVLKPLYEKYHSRGLEIYSISLDTDKSEWAGTVKAQKLPWINVCDSQGSNSRAVLLYNVNKIPVTFFIANGALSSDVSVGGEKDLSKIIDKLL